MGVTVDLVFRKELPLRYDSYVQRPSFISMLCNLRERVLDHGSPSPLRKGRLGTT